MSDDNYYRRKLYAFLKAAGCPHLDRVNVLSSNLSELQAWWDAHGTAIENIARSSDRVGLPTTATARSQTQNVPIRHLISGQDRTIAIAEPTDPQWEALCNGVNEASHGDPLRAFWWLWRFYPEWLQNPDGSHASDPDALLRPADRTIPDCPHHSYVSTVSAIVGAAFPPGATTAATTARDRPHVLLFSFSPVQDFIKASRKFLDFWAGSYLLHYLSARLCWHVAQILGPDAIVIPSLWSQEIVDALLAKEFGFDDDLETYTGSTPKDRYENGQSTSLVTAGFPNAITLLVAKGQAKDIGDQLTQTLRQEWQAIAETVRDRIRTDTCAFLKDPKRASAIAQLIRDLAAAESLDPNTPENPNRHELGKLKVESNWQWRHLWDAQINNTWEPYWAAIPLGSSDTPTADLEQWIETQDAIAPPAPDLAATLTEAERAIYGNHINIGSWWSNVQTRSRHAVQAIKNTRTWKIPAAPGPRSTLSGQFSAVHPRLDYQLQSNCRDFREGAGLSSGSMQLFWRLMEQVFPGLFNGSEMLNALELTKRMAWAYGGVPETLGIQITVEQEDLSEEERAAIGDGQNDPEEPETDDRQIDYETLVRFPNLSSIAASRFIQQEFARSPTVNVIVQYWRTLKTALVGAYGDDANRIFSSRQRRAFLRKTRRPTQCPATDRAIDLNHSDLKRAYNGNMFSARWLADDMALEPSSQVSPDSPDRLTELRAIVDKTQRDNGFASGSPSDWWAIVLADGDGMGQYVAGTKLESYGQYIVSDAVDRANIRDDHWQTLLATRKRMTPATHIGLNRALLDFSNRLVPYLTEQRHCGRVIYSGGDDVMVVLPLEDLPGFLRSLRAAWSGQPDPNCACSDSGGYWRPNTPEALESLPDRNLFTMGETATMSAGIVIAHQSVPLPTVLETLWEAEASRAKAMPDKDGLCFRVAYGNGSVLEALMKGNLLEQWWRFVEPAGNCGSKENVLSPLLYRLSEELPRRACFTRDPRHHLFAKAAAAIADRRETDLPTDSVAGLIDWIQAWEDWVLQIDPDCTNLNRDRDRVPLGCNPEDLANLMRFTAFWLDKMAQRVDWSRDATPNNGSNKSGNGTQGGDP